MTSTKSGLTLLGKCSDTNTLENKTIKYIGSVDKDVVVLFEDGTYLSTGLDKVDDSLREALSKDDSLTLAGIKEKLDKLLDNVVEVSDFSGKTTFKAISKEFNQ